MINIKAVLDQRPDLFDNLAARWHMATGGELALLSPQGKVIKSHNGLNLAPCAVAYNADTGELELASQIKAIVTPMTVYGETKGHLLSVNSTPTQLPMLTWAAETLLDYLNSEQALQGMTDELIVAWDQLELVYRITQTLGAHTSLSNVLTSTLEEIIKVVMVELAFIIYAADNQIKCVKAGSQALPMSIDNPALLDKLAGLDHLVLFNSREMALDLWPDAPEPVYNFIGAPIPTGNETVAALGLINNTKNHAKRDFTAGDAKLITSVTEQIGPIFDYFGLQNKLIAQERVRRELEIAAEIQESLLPGSTPQVKGLKIDVSTLPAYEVGGDFYDFICPESDQLTIVVGDVAGKGIPAAMFTSMIRTMLRIEALHSQEPDAIIKRVNEVLQEDLGRAESFVTAFVATVDTNASVLMFANAGHVPGIIYHARSKKSRMLRATSVPIGIAGHDHKTTQYVHLAPGDTLVLYSDGVTEASNPKGQLFGLKRVQDLVHEYADQPPNRLKQIILDDLANFRQTEVCADDVTLIVIKFSPDTTKFKKVKSYQIIDAFQFEYPADTVHLGDISQMVTRACRGLSNLPPDSKGDDFVYLVELAVSEICTNIIEHAYAGVEGYINGTITLTSVGIEIDVYDQGKGFNPNAVPPPISDPMDPSEGGYGLHIVRQIMDVAKYEVDTSLGNHWKLIKYLPD